jgi:CheY-like chemotaxis protein
VDGEAFIQALRERFGDLTPPVVVVSASMIRTEIARRIGAAASLAKPFSLEDIRDVAWRFAHDERERQTGEVA